MNANELADLIESGGENIDRKELSLALRQFDLAESIIKQQQIEITNMQERMIMSEQELNHMRSFFGCDPAYYGMTPAEPVAWMHKEVTSWVSTFIHPETETYEWLPLYTHPANVDSINTSKQYVDKTQNNRHDLTDEEITAIWQTDECYQKAQNFARAILRKAQEK
jgi:hypothetical protein